MFALWGLKRDLNFSIQKGSKPASNGSWRPSLNTLLFQSSGGAILVEKSSEKKKENSASVYCWNSKILGVESSLSSLSKREVDRTLRIFSAGNFGS